MYFAPVGLNGCPAERAGGRLGESFGEPKEGSLNGCPAERAGGLQRPHQTRFRVARVSMDARPSARADIVSESVTF